MKKIVIISILVVQSIFSLAQNTIGIPDIINYTKDKYGAGTQNRGIVQDKNGIVYFANHEGLLSFDGVYWKLYPLPNKTIVRSVAIGKDNRIYAGGQDDFGYFSPDKSGKLFYKSLKPLLTAQNYSFTDIWNIVPYGDDIFFRSQEKIFQFSNNTITVYPASSQWQFLGLAGNQLIAQDTKNGLLLFSNNVWAPFITASELPDEYRVTCVFPFGKDSSFLATINTGFYILTDKKVTKFNFAGVNPFFNQRILTAIPVTKDWIAVGTNLNGCYIINKKGEIIQNLSRKEGLQINNIISLFVDNSNNLWLGLDNGIDFIAYNNAITHIYPETLNEGEGYTSLIFKNELYVGTSNGVYKVPLTEKNDLSFVNGEFIPIHNTKGSSWNLSEVNGSLLLGHHDGAFLVKDNTVVPIDKNNTYWIFLPFYNVLPSSLVIGGNEGGINFLKYDNGQFISTGNIPVFNESSQFIVPDNNNTILWVAHPYRGVYKVDISDLSRPKVKLYDNKNGLPSSLKNHLFKIRNRIVVTTEKGVYEYNVQKDAFTLSGYFSSLFGSRNIRYLKEDDAGNIWFIEEKNLGVANVSSEPFETIYFPELDGKMVSGNEHIYPYNKYNVFVGAEKGLYHINYDEYKKNRYKVRVKISSVRAFGKTDSLVYGGYFGEINEVKEQPSITIPEIGNPWNSFHFEYSSPLYEHLNSVTYSYFLEGFDKDWSAWSKKAEKDYTDLAAGNYTFHVKAKSNLGNESAVSSYTFSVLPPWYKTYWALFIYALVIVSLFYAIYRRQKRLLLQQQIKHEEEQKQLQYLHQLELEKSEKEIIKLKNEKLESEIDHKNTELASTAMHLVQKGELLTNIKEEMNRLKKNINGHATGDEFKKVLRILNEETKMDKDWEQFAVHFDNVHSDFLKSLKTAHPNLSPHELKLCAYLRMNLSSKQIAQLENISVRGVEISRYRLRKKLMLAKETSLFNFLLEIDNGEKAG